MPGKNRREAPECVWGGIFGAKRRKQFRGDVRREAPTIFGVLSLFLPFRPPKAAGYVFFFLGAKFGILFVFRFFFRRESPIFF